MNQSVGKLAGSPCAKGKPISALHVAPWTSAPAIGPLGIGVSVAESRLTAATRATLAFASGLEALLVRRAAFGLFALLARAECRADFARTLSCFARVARHLATLLVVAFHVALLACHSLLLAAFECRMSTSVPGSTS